MPPIIQYLGRSEDSRFGRAPRAAIYAACLDPIALAIWRAPEAMTASLHSVEPVAGGVYRMTPTYTDLNRSAEKTTAAGDRFEGCFVELEPDVRIVEAIILSPPIRRSPARCG